jgi:hypothetical protein
MKSIQPFGPSFGGSRPRCRAATIKGVAAMTIRPSGTLRMTRVATALPAIPAINFPHGNAPEVSTLSDFVVRFAMFISSMRSRVSKAFRVEYDRHSMPMPMSLNGLITRKVHMTMH